MPADSSPLRCHLLIGPPASGKSTLAAVLARLVGGRVLATDALRAELFGDAATQGPWAAVEALLHQRIEQAVAAGVPVILDATHCQRPWRLAITQALPLPAPVQWIGWWLTTPLEQCLAWNQQRAQPVPPEVITRMVGHLSNRQRPPHRQEGFAQLITLDPLQLNNLEHHAREQLAQIDRSIHYATLRRKTVALHRYSRLLDLERLLYLIRLLLEFPGLEFYNHRASPPQLLKDVELLRRTFVFQPDQPLPAADALFAERAAFVLGRRHGPCYEDVDAVAFDLAWLEREQFSAATTVTTAISPGPPSPQAEAALRAGAGFPQAADQSIFQRQLGLLRYLIQNPFDHPSADDSLERDLRLPRPSRAGSPAAKAPRSQSASLRLYLLSRLQTVDGVNYTSKRSRYRRSSSGSQAQPAEASAGRLDPDQQQIRTLDKDIETLIGGFGFRNLLTPP
jgi:predicted kinase